MKKSVLVICAVQQELHWLVSELGLVWCEQQATWQREHGVVKFVVVGIGMVNTAFGLTRHLANADYSAIVMVGSCGSYDPQLAIGDVILPQQEINGDLGIVTEQNWQSPELFGFPLMTIANRPYWHRFPCHVANFELCEPNFQTHLGTMVTLSAVSASQQRAQILRARYAAIGENMEGAAAAQIALLQQKDFYEIRGISNIAGERDKTRWNFSLAHHNAQLYLKKLLARI